MATCVDCGEFFERGSDEGWKVRCWDCWKARQSKGRRDSLISELENQLHFYRQRCAELEAQQCRHNGADLEHELLEQLPRLLLVAHPDRHGNSQASTRATQWLLNVKSRLS